MIERTQPVYDVIYEAFDNLEMNSLAALGKPDAPMWERPLMGVAAGDDAYFDFLKEHIGAFHWSPAEAFSLKYGEAPKADRLRVLSVIFPQTEETKALQARENRFPCAEWAVSRGEWNALVLEFGKRTEAALEKKGIRAVCIDTRPELSFETSDKLGRAASWSHRHSAFAAGMGTFGLSDGFITEKGMAVRMTTLVLEAELDVTPRDGRGHYDWCLYFKSGICGACIRRCPKRAISEKGHDKEVCAAYLRDCFEHCSENLDTSGYMEVGCGLCQSKIPCMDKRP